MAQHPPLGQDVLIVQVSRLHSETPHSVGLLWSSDQSENRDLYLKTHDTHKRETFMPSVAFEPGIPASERPQTHTLDRAATGTTK